MEEKDYWDPETWEMIKDTKCEWKEYIKVNKEDHNREEVKRN